MLWYAAYLALRAKKYGADLAVIDSVTTHYFALVFFWFARIPVAVNLHNVLWRISAERPKCDHQETKCMVFSKRCR